jgi:hypothetical protein
MLIASRAKLNLPQKHLRYYYIEKSVKVNEIKNLLNSLSLVLTFGKILLYITFYAKLYCK